MMPRTMVILLSQMGNLYAGLIRLFKIIYYTPEFDSLFDSLKVQYFTLILPHIFIFHPRLQ